MAYPLIVSTEAEADLDQAYRWYEQQRPGLGRDFLLRVHDVFERIRRAPLAFAETHRTVRQALVRRFPYVVCYTFDGQRVNVVAVFHGHRDPNEWKQRGI
jgi:plasmid stabilization system protein ParE